MNIYSKRGENYSYQGNFKRKMYVLEAMAHILEARGRIPLQWEWGLASWQVKNLISVKNLLKFARILTFSSIPLHHQCPPGLHKPWTGKSPSKWSPALHQYYLMSHRTFAEGHFNPCVYTPAAGWRVLGSASPSRGPCRVGTVLLRVICVLRLKLFLLFIFYIHQPLGAMWSASDGPPPSWWLTASHSRG